jgi:predicted phosphate transport protein (TIGR00153 family)
LFGLIPTDKGFFELLDQAAAVVVRTAEAFAEIARDFPNRQVHIDKIRQCEHDGDEIVHRGLQKLDTTFLTPFDREDIHNLLKQLDDVVDDIDAVAKRFTLYRVDMPTSWLGKQAEVLLSACRLVGESVARLRNIGKHEGLQERLVEIHRMENEGDENNHAAIAELFSSASDAIFVMKWKEIYERTERAIDACEDVANTIEGIVLKNS